MNPSEGTSLNLIQYSLRQVVNLGGQNLREHANTGK